MAGWLPPPMPASRVERAAATCCGIGCDSWRPSARCCCGLLPGVGDPWQAANGIQWRRPVSTCLHQSVKGIRTIKEIMSYWEMSNTMMGGGLTYATEAP